MLSIRFSRRGKKKQSHFRIIVLEKTKDPWGNFLEDLGYYNPHSKKAGIKRERVLYWISQGAKPSGSVNNLLVKEGIIKRKKVKVTKVHRKEKEKQEEKERKEEKKEKEPREKEMETDNDSAKEEGKEQE